MAIKLGVGFFLRQRLHNRKGYWLNVINQNAGPTINFHVKRKTRFSFCEGSFPFLSFFSSLFLSLSDRNFDEFTRVERETFRQIALAVTGEFDECDRKGRPRFIGHRKSRLSRNGNQIDSRGFLSILPPFTSQWLVSLSCDVIQILIAILHR